MKNTPINTEKSLQYLWNRYAEEPLSPEEELAMENSLQDALRKTRYRQSAFYRSLPTYAMRYAALLLLPLLGILGFLYIENTRIAPQEWIECYVPNGEIKTMTLPDGTQISLNSGTVLLYPTSFKHLSSREVYISGEADFKVSPDRSKPFIVHSGPLAIKVLGTHFNVESYPETNLITTTLQEGSVCIYPKDSPQRTYLLKPNEALVYHKKENTFNFERFAGTDANAWTKGALCFHNKRITDILNTFERRYNVKIMVDPAVALSEHYTVKFTSSETIEDAMWILAQINNKIHYTITDSVVRIYPNHTLNK